MSLDSPRCTISEVCAQFRVLWLLLQNLHSCPTPGLATPCIYPDALLALDISCTYSIAYLWKISLSYSIFTEKMKNESLPVIIHLAIIRTESRVQSISKAWVSLLSQTHDWNYKFSKWREFILIQFYIEGSQQWHCLFTDSNTIV